MKHLAFVALNFAIFGTHVFGQSTQALILSDVVDGGGWQSTIVLTNSTAVPATATLIFHSDTQGGGTQPWTPPFLEVSSTSGMTLTGGSSLYLHTRGTAAALSQGWAELNASAGIMAYVIFTNRVPVRQDQDALRPVAAHQQVGQRDDSASLPRARRHHHQGLALTILLERFPNPADRSGLIVPLHDRLIDRCVRQRAAGGAALDQQCQFIAAGEALHRAGRILRIVPEIVFVAVGGDNHRALAVFAFQAIGVEFGLLLALGGAVAGGFGLYHRQRLAVGSPEDIVAEADARGVRHAGYLDLGHPWGVRVPAGLAQQLVDEQVAGRGFPIIVRVGHGFVGGDDLRGGRLQLGVEAGVPRLGRFQRRVFFFQFGLKLLQLCLALPSDGGGGRGELMLRLLLCVLEL